MNKICLLFSVLFFLFSFLIFPQSITVTSPSPDEVVTRGEAYTIRWTKTGTMITTVKIRLLNSTGTVKIKDITNAPICIPSPDAINIGIDKT